MRVLTLKQPWAWALFFAGKDIENRTWRTHHRGPLLISASSTLSRKEYEGAKDWMQNVFGVPYVPNRDELDYGVIVGKVDIVDCVQKSDSVWFEGNYDLGQKVFGWVVENPVSIIPIPYKGKLSFGNYDGKIKVINA